jgi:hypothetical protein
VGRAAVVRATQQALRIGRLDASEAQAAWDTAHVIEVIPACDWVGRRNGDMCGCVAMTTFAPDLIADTVDVQHALTGPQMQFGWHVDINIRDHLGVNKDEWRRWRDNVILEVAE